MLIWIPAAWDSWEKWQTCWRKTYCLLVRLKRYSVCRPLRSDISCDMTHALKACIHHHPSFGVNLKVAAVWMSTPYTCGHFQMPPLFIRQLWSRTDKGAAEEEGKRRWRIFFFHVVAGRPNGIKSARPSVFHIMLQKKNMGMKRESLKGKGDDLLLYWFTNGKWMNGRSWFDTFVVESLFT